MSFTAILIDIDDFVTVLSVIYDCFSHTLTVNIRSIISLLTKIIVIDRVNLRCGQTDVYIKPECVCSFYNVYEATLYHGYSSCPPGNVADLVTKLKCMLHTSLLNEFHYFVWISTHIYFLFYVFHARNALKFTWADFSDQLLKRYTNKCWKSTLKFFFV